MTKTRNINRKRWHPTAAELELVRLRFPTTRTPDLAQALGVVSHQVERMARKLGLKKDPAWLNGPSGGRLNGQQGGGFRFQPGHKPWTTGLKMGAEWAKPTQFKPGHRTHNHKPVGSLRLASIGYLQIKLTDTGYAPHDWVMYHRHVWQQAHGPIAEGHMVVFRDGRRRTAPEDITLDALECITQAEHMRRQTIHRHGPEVAALVQLRGALARQINRRQQAQAQAEQQATTDTP